MSAGHRRWAGGYAQTRFQAGVERGADVPLSQIGKGEPHISHIQERNCASPFRPVCSCCWQGQWWPSHSAAQREYLAHRRGDL